MYYTNGASPRVRALAGGSRPVICVAENDVLCLTYNVGDDTIKVATSAASMTTAPLEVPAEVSQEIRGARFAVYVLDSRAEHALPDVFILPSLYPFS